MISRIQNSTRLKHYRNKCIDFSLYVNDIIVFFKLIFKLNYKEQKSFYFLTASDHTHFLSLQNFFDSVEKFCPNDKIIFYDLGLNSDQKNKILNSYKNVQYKKFNFKDYPKFVNINEKNFGSYAWKPAIIFNELSKLNQPLIWCDAGNLLTKKITILKNYILIKEFFSPLSTGTLFEFTHSSVLDALKVEKSLYRKRNLNAAVIGFSSYSDNFDLVNNWFKFSQQKEYIGPENADLSNHRFDQALLSVLYYKLINKSSRFKTYKAWGIQLHRDVD